MEEIKDIVSLKISHRRNIIKRKKKFGYESNSTIGLNITIPKTLLEADAEDMSTYNK